MTRLTSFSYLLFTAMFFLYLGISNNTICQAEVTTSGSILDNSSHYYIAYADYSIGSLNINGGSSVTKEFGMVGYGIGSTGTATVNGNESHWINNDNIFIGYDGDGILTVEAGGKVSNEKAFIGYHAGSTGAVTVTGTGSTWINNSSLYVGRTDDGTLTVIDGGEVIAETLYASQNNLLGNGIITANGGVLDMDLVFDSTHGASQAISFGSGGTLNLSITESSYLGVGYKGSGSLRIADGITIESQQVYLGLMSGSMGTAVVSGNNSKLKFAGGGIYIGRSGNAELTVEAGGFVVGGSSYVGSSESNSPATGSVKVTGPDSLWNSTYGLYISNGTVMVEAGGQVGSAENCYIGYESGTKSTVNIRGEGTKWTNLKKFYIGSEGVGEVTVESGAQVFNGSILVLKGELNVKSGAKIFSSFAHIYSSVFNSTVTITGEGSKWTNYGDMEVGNAGSGVLNITDGGFVGVYQQLSIDPYGAENSSINMSSGGMLVLKGHADSSLEAFLDLVDGTDEIRYWDDSISDWAHISGATYGEDYTLTYITEGILEGCTMLTVTTAPEPATLGLLAMGGLTLFSRRKKS